MKTYSCWDVLTSLVSLRLEGPGMIGAVRKPTVG